MASKNLILNRISFFQEQIDEMGGNNSKSKKDVSKSQATSSASTSYQQDVPVRRQASKQNESYSQEYVQWLRKQSSGTPHSSALDNENELKLQEGIIENDASKEKAQHIGYIKQEEFASDDAGTDNVDDDSNDSSDDNHTNDVDRGDNDSDDGDGLDDNETMVEEEEDSHSVEEEREVSGKENVDELTGTMPEKESELTLTSQIQLMRNNTHGAMVDSKPEEHKSNEYANKSDTVQKKAYKKTEVLVKLTLPAAMDWQVVSDDLKDILKHITFKPIKSNIYQHKDNFCVKFTGRKQANEAMQIIRTTRKSIKVMDCETVFETCRKEILNEKQKVLTIHQSKCHEITKKMAAFQVGNSSKRKQFHTLEVHERLEVLKQKARELNFQLTEFVKVTEELVTRLDNLETIQNKDVSSELKEIQKRFQREKARIDSALPIYAEKSRIVDIVQEHQVCIILGETGSGKSTQLVQYLYDAGFAEKGTIVCTQPRKVAAFSLGKRVSEELKDSKLVDCLEGTKRIKKTSKILFTTDHSLLMKCIKDQDLPHFSCVVIDEAHERSIYTDLLLGIIKKALPKRPDLRIIVTSATIDPSLFQTYFGGCPVLRVSGKLFPVDVEWKRKQQGDSKLDHSKDYVKEAVDKVVDIHRKNEQGDILVFLTCPAEIDRACSIVSSRIKTNDLVCLALHGKLQQDDQRKVFDPTPVGKRKVVFSTNCAETSLTIPGIKFVVDSGRAKEMKYDPKRNLNSLEVAIISQSSAKQRMGRAGRTDSGKCFRLYTEEDFSEMEKSSKPEILRVHLGQALLKLAELGISDPAYFDYVQSPPMESIRIAMSDLMELEAIKDGQLTELGRKMARVPVDPRLARFLFEGLQAGVAYEALVLISVATVNGSVFFRMGTEEEKKQADVKKIEFCHLGGDFMTLLDVFRAWRTIDERDRGRWCYEKSLNAKAMRLANETVKDLKATLKRDLNIHDIPWSTFDRETTDKILQKILFSCFLTKLCVFTGHEKAGYRSVIGGHHVKVHPSSVLKVMGEYPKFVVYEKILKTSQDFILNVTPIEENFLRESITSESLLREVEQLVDNMMVTHLISCSPTLINKTLQPLKDKMPMLESLVSKSCNDTPVVIEVDKKCGYLKLFVSGKYADVGKSVVQSFLDEGRKELRNGTAEYQVEGASSLRVVMQSGFTVRQILMPDMYRSVFVGNVPRYTENLRDFLNTFGKVTDVSPCRNNKPVIVTYEKPDEAATAVQSRQLFVDQGYSIWPTMNKQQNSANFNFVVKMNWLRRQPKGMANVSFESCCEIVPWADMPQRWSLKVMIGSITAAVNADKFRPNSIFIRNLDPLATKTDIKRALLPLFPDTPVEESDITIQYKQREQISVNTQSQTTVLKNIISQYAAPGSYEVSVREFPPQQNKCVFATARASFSSPNEGIKVSQNLQENKYFEGLERWPVTLDIHPCLDFYYTSLKQVYHSVKGVVQRQIDEIAKECHQECEETLVLKETAFGRPDLSRVKLSVEAKCLNHYLEALTAISRAIQGERFDCSKTQELKMLLDSSGRDLLTNIQKETGVLICPDERTMSLIIYGTSLQKEKALDAIHEFTLQMALSDTSVWEVKLKGPDKPRGLLKQIMSAFGRNLERLCDIEGVSKVSKCIFQHTLAIHSTRDAKETVLQRIKEIEKPLSIQTQKKEDRDAESEKCPICFCEAETPYQLAICGHVYCTKCVIDQLKQLQFPMACAHENCSEPFALNDIERIVRYNGDNNDLLHKTTRKAIDSYLGDNQDKARPCPSPDCPMVYLTTCDGKLFRCNVCSTSTCTSCHKPYHLGMTCKEYDIDMEDPGGQELLEEWMRTNPSKRKPCPGCSTRIEKMGGCSHMHCVHCKKHFCWNCMKVFSSGQNVYDHQADCHGN